MPYSERLRLESELLPDMLLSELLLLEEVLPEPVDAEPAMVVPVDVPLLESVVLPSFLEEEPDLAFVEDDLDPEEVVVLLLSVLAEVDEAEPEVAPVPELLLLDPVPLMLLPVVVPPLLLLLLLAVLPDDEDALGVLDELSDELVASVEL